MNDELMKELASAIRKQTEVMASQSEILASLKEDGREKAASNVQTAPGLHGFGGLFSTPGLDRDVITAHVRPSGLVNILPRIPTVDQNPLYTTITGFQEGGQAEATNACDDAPTGYMKGCTLTARFGMIRRDTNTIEMDKVMLQVNRSDFTDLLLRGRILGINGLTPSGLDESQILNILTMSEMVTAGVNAERRLITQTWQGTVAAGMFPGLDVQIATGQVDSEQNVLCPAMDSDVKNFNYDLIGGGGRDIVEYLSMLEFYLTHNAETMGLDPVTHVIAMRPELWFELSAVWPCAYNTNRCGTLPTGASVTVDGRENTNDRDKMRASKTIIINGNTYQVVTDTGIFEHTNVNNANVPAGSYASSIYMIPMTITGSFPVTYLQYIDYRRATPDTNILSKFGGAPDYFWTDDGMYSWSVEQQKWCYKLALKIEPRIILRTPQLAGRIDNVLYTPLQHLRSPDPESPYFADGGVSLRSVPAASQYAIWLP